MKWLDLYLRHPAGWHVLKERGARRLAFMRAQAAEAARLAAEHAASIDDLDDALAKATNAILDWSTVPEGQYAEGEKWHPERQ